MFLVALSNKGTFTFACNIPKLALKTRSQTASFLLTVMFLNNLKTECFSGTKRCKWQGALQDMRYCTVGCFQAVSCILHITSQYSIWQRGTVCLYNALCFLHTAALLIVYKVMQKPSPLTTVISQTDKFGNELMMVAIVCRKSLVKLKTRT